LKKFLKIFLPLLFGIGILIYFLRGFTPEQFRSISESIKSARYDLIFLSMLLGLSSHILRALRWKIMLDPVAEKPVRNANLIAAVGISYLMNLGIPRSGEVSRALLVSKYEKIPFNKTFGTIITERIIDLIILAGFILTALALSFDRFYALIHPHLPAFSLFRFTVFVLISGTLIFLFFRFKNSGNRFMRRIADFLEGTLKGGFSLLNSDRRILFIVETVLIWVLYLLMLYLVMLAFPATRHLGFEAILIVFVTGSLSIVLSNGGIGTYQVFVTEALLLYGVSKENGFAFSMTMWTSQTLIVILFGLTGFILLPLLNRRYSKPSSTNP
jgi:uncharacterized protein (TIRG00374 family)